MEIETDGACCTCTREEKGIEEFGGGNLKERDNLKDLGRDWRIVLKWILKQWDERTWSGVSWLRLGTSGGLL
jgi:hypothetical protein